LIYSKNEYKQQTMKTRFLVLLVISVFISEMQAQEISKNAIGVRFGDSRGFGVEANYQRAVGSNNNRIELGLATRSGKQTDAIKFTGLYEWVWNIDGGLNWYAGPGAGDLRPEVNFGNYVEDVTLNAGLSARYQF
jgi:hypothetical protein